MLFPQQSTEWNRRLETIRTLAASIEGKYQNTMVVLTADMNQVNIQNIAGLRRVGPASKTHINGRSIDYVFANTAITSSTFKTEDGLPISDHCATSGTHTFWNRVGQGQKERNQDHLQEELE